MDNFVGGAKSLEKYSKHVQVSTVCSATATLQHTCYGMDWTHHSHVLSLAQMWPASQCLWQTCPGSQTSGGSGRSAATVLSLELLPQMQRCQTASLSQHPAVIVNGILEGCRLFVINMIVAKTVEGGKPGSPNKVHMGVVHCTKSAQCLMGKLDCAKSHLLVVCNVTPAD